MQLCAICAIYTSYMIWLQDICHRSAEPNCLQIVEYLRSACINRKNLQALLQLIALFPHVSNFPRCNFLPNMNANASPECLFCATFMCKWPSKSKHARSNLCGKISPSCTFSVCMPIYVVLASLLYNSCREYRENFRERRQFLKFAHGEYTHTHMKLFSPYCYTMCRQWHY